MRDDPSNSPLRTRTTFTALVSRVMTNVLDWALFYHAEETADAAKPASAQMCAGMN